MRSIKPPFNLHRILEFGFRNTSLDKLLPIPQILELANYQRAFCAERAALSAPLRSHALARAHLASRLLLCPNSRTPHMYCMKYCYNNYIINIIHRKASTQRIYTRISIQVTVDHAEHQGEVGTWGVTKSSQCFGKSCILAEVCLY